MSEPVPSWEPLSEEVLADQVGTYDRMRVACPAAASPRGVTLFRHADVVAAANDPERFSSAASGRRAVPNTIDPPEHARWRALVDRFFSRERMVALEPRVRAIAGALVEDLPRGATIDAVAEIGRPLAVRAQTEWLGWQGTEEQLLVWMADNHDATRSGDRERTAAVAAAFDEIVAAQVERRRRLGDAAPDDPTTELTTATFDGRPLEDGEIVSILRNWTAGDLGSMAAAIGVVVHFLATHLDVQEELRRDPTQLTPAIDEMLRIDDPFLVNRRVTTESVRVGPHVLPAGTRVYLNWTSANRDEAVFGDPDAFRPVEHAPNNLVYGTGIHVCPGRPLATMELVVTTETLLAATTAVELAPDVTPVRETYPVGGWRHVPIRLR
ncbi:MAG: cytochrome P450 [Acidimicrobiia bacterium]